ncbi:C6 finger domain-containing protein (putative fungal zinc cluster transcription factor) [Colletotrichum truncatum]|uniref:C6 finger domain-containing protein (Putative fungal zinc cluster transcription factor) n=1 Tax=Colletotrichum truncatum TaxID=5467 RepID=A0ACC3Z2Y9_COLTU|nr:C6 finger domain-containing protein (putative fungal zinc cluster transcription factor) [Colletotrichum truncatum]KAF6793247.1 C6 finger domain-containing protein (putative fungal zinc cluster transcription factor) [Colletotrichum truncatum]
MVTNRIRVVEGSCWPCKKRRIKCDLTKPRCVRCTKIGADCDFSTRRLKWSTRPTIKAPAIYQIATRDEQLALSLAADEKRALDYFRHRLWPMLTTAQEPCAAPVLQALENRVVLLATCVIADAHRVLQDGRNSRNLLRMKRLECLAAVRGELCGAQIDMIDKESLMTLLLAVLLLYFHDGYLECAQSSASTLSHHGGVRAIVDTLGGINTVLNTSHESIHMLLSEFASTDLTTVMLKGGHPAFPPEIWNTIDNRSVWWGKDILGRSSLASVFHHTSRLAWYLDSLSRGEVELSMATVRGFETALSPTYARIMDTSGGASDSDFESKDEANHAFTLIRAFQHTALIYMYRAICGLPVGHSLVQQHVLPCLECILDIRQPAKVLNCVVFPLLVAGAHVQSPRHRKAVLGLVHVIRDEMRFASFNSVSDVLTGIWKEGQEDVTWFSMFSELAADAIVL